MKTKIVPLHAKAKARLPNKITKDTALKDLSPLALQLLVYIAYRWDQRQREIAHIPPSRRTIEHFTFEVRWRELHAHITPGSAARFVHHDYRSLRIAVEELASFKASQDRRDVNGKRGFTILNLLQGANYEEAGSVLTYRLSWQFATAIDILRGKGFTLVPLADAFALHDTRQLAMLMLAAMVLKLYLPAERTFTVHWLREYFGLQSVTYENWREAFYKLKAAASAVTVHTNYQVKLVSVSDRKDGRRVSAVRIDSKLRVVEQPALEHAPIRTKPTIKWPQRITFDDDLIVVKKKPKLRLKQRPLTFQERLEADDIAMGDRPPKPPKPTLYEPGTCYED